MMEAAAMRSRSDFSFGYAITRRSGPVSVRSPAITAYCMPEESTICVHDRILRHSSPWSYALRSSKRHSKLISSGQIC